MDGSKTFKADTDVEALDSDSGIEQQQRIATNLATDENAQQQALASYVADTAAEKRLVRKIDFILLPCLWWMYVLAYVDRGNVANANAAGMSEDLNLSSNDYSLIVSIFFIGYTIFEVPSNLLLNKVAPHRYLTAILVVWGACVAAMSTAKTSKHFLVGRFFLGCIEAGLFPGSLFLLTCWYKKKEVGKRFCIFYTSGCVSPALGGIMAGAIISGLDGRLGWPGWRWLLLIEGVVTVGFGFILYFVLIDYPLTTKRFFTEEEKRLAYVRILSVLAVVADPRSYAFLVLYILDSTSTSISYFVPATLKAMGYTSVTAQWMTVPIWISGATIMLILSWNSDRTGDRRWHTTGCMIMCLVCSIVCLTVKEPNPRYAMLCFYIGGLYTAVAQILNWASEEMSFPDQKRSVALAFVNSFGNLSIIWGSRLWITTEAPGYKTGFTTVAIMTGIAALLAAAMPIMFSYLPSEPRTKAERALLKAAEEAEPELASQGGKP